MPDSKITSVSQLPVHHGDGYGWGGDWIVTIGGLSINLGVGENARRIAHLIAAAPGMLAALELLIADFGDYPAGGRPCYAFDVARAASAAATGESV